MAIEDTIETNTQKPRSASIDGMAVSQHSLQDQIAADKYLSGKTQAGGSSPRLLINKLISPGPV